MYFVWPALLHARIDRGKQSSQGPPVPSTSSWLMSTELKHSAIVKTIILSSATCPTYSETCTPFLVFEFIMPK